jgi:ABC transport system ATP-binding/permease protein
MSGERSEGPVLEIRSEASSRMLRADESCLIGRDPQADIVLDDPRVSWRHAVVAMRDGTWVLEDRASQNGTFVDGERRVRIVLEPAGVVRLGHPRDGPRLWCAASAARAASAVLAAPRGPLTIGRASGNDVVVGDLSVSRHHAELRPGGDGAFEIVDLGSRNGTFLNGARVARAKVTSSDLVSVGNARFRLDGDRLSEFVDDGDISVTARDLSVRLPNGKVLLDDVSLALGPRSFAAIIGPSGAGKSTLLGALTGLRPAGAGSVLYDGRDLYRGYGELRQRIGLVPQENLLHPQLSALRALDYAAQLRFPRDTSASERRGRVDEVIEELGMRAHRDTRIAELSGGQQKRVNVALELLTKPSLLFLDEPTSGLDPGLDKSVMQLLRGLTREGRTVIVVTHAVANLDLCDRVVVLAPGGRLAFFGPPSDGLAQFGADDWADVFQLLAADGGTDWAARFAGGRRSAEGPVEPVARPVSAPAPRPRQRLAQFVTLVRRYLAILAADRIFLAVLLCVPVVLGLLIRATPAAGGLDGPAHRNQEVESLLLIVAICACFAGAMSSVRELVKERSIYLRERAVGVSPLAYLASKLVVLGGLSAAQAVVMLLIGLAGRQLPASGSLLRTAPLVELVLAAAALAAASMALGLLVSAFTGSSEKVMPLLMLAVVVQVLLSGGIFALHGKAGLAQISWLSPSRWGFAMAASTVNLTRIAPVSSGYAGDALWVHGGATWLADLVALLALGAAFSALTWARLVRAASGGRG